MPIKVKGKIGKQQLNNKQTYQKGGGRERKKNKSNKTILFG